MEANIGGARIYIYELQLFVQYEQPLRIYYNWNGSFFELICV